MIDDRASVTAQRAAMRRALHQLIDTPRVFDDPLAMRIIGADAARELRDDPGRLVGSATATALRAFLAVRSRVAEDELAAAVKRGVRQYVVVAAGLDTFAYRNPHPRLNVFEVDHPATQAWKRERLAAVGIPIPESVTFVAADLATTDLRDCLDTAGFDDRAPAFFSWLGTVPYLEAETVDTTLRAIAGLTVRGGGVVFDYSTPPDSLTPEHRRAWDAFADRVRAVGEPLRCFLEPAALVADLRSMGFTDVQDLDGPTLTARYFGGRTDGLRAGLLGHIMTALNKVSSRA